MSGLFPFTVRVPATTANFGSAFDAIGMALDLWLEARVEESATHRVEVRGEGSDALPAGDRNLILRAAAFRANRLGIDLPPLHLTIDNSIPLTRGLGSSAAAVAAGLLIADVISGRHPEPEQLLSDATELEGHPDNAAPALFGGVCLAIQPDDGPPIARQLPFPDSLACAAFIPDAVLPTHLARSALPKQVPLPDATFNLARSALLVRALITRQWNDLALATEDRLHQPYRADLVPGLATLTRAATDAKAYAAFLSGAGPTIMALTAPADADSVAAAMGNAAHSLGIAGRVLALAPSKRGAHVVAES